MIYEVQKPDRIKIVPNETLFDIDGRWVLIEKVLEVVGDKIKFKGKVLYGRNTERLPEPILTSLREFFKEKYWSGSYTPIPTVNKIDEAIDKLKNPKILSIFMENERRDWNGEDVIELVNQIWNINLKNDEL